MQKVIIASGPVIVQDGKVLLDKSGDDDFWKFCGGKVKHGQDLKETAIIRAKEELGINVEITNNEPYIMYVPKPGDENIDVILVHFLAGFQGKIAAGSSVDEWIWLDVHNLPEDIAPNIVPTLRHFGFLN